MESESYEFTNAQEQVIEELADKMRLVSHILMALGGLLMIAGMVRLREGGITGILNGIVQLVIGIWTNKAASSFTLIIKTQGKDIENLMKALTKLRKLYSLQYWLLIISLILIGIGLVAAMSLPLRLP